MYNACMSDHLIRLEEKIAFLERYVEELDSAVRELSTRLDTVNSEMLRMHSETHARIHALTMEDEDVAP
jgi:uncharacterized coiled-coil protein SlyX